MPDDDDFEAAANQNARQNAERTLHSRRTRFFATNRAFQDMALLYAQTSIETDHENPKQMVNLTELGRLLENAYTVRETARKKYDVATLYLADIMDAE